MKKLFALLLAGLMLVGCSSNTTTTTPTETTEPEATEETTTTEETTGSLKLGVGSVTSISSADATEDKDGKVQFNTTYASVVLDGDVVVAAYFDVAQNTGNFGTDGTVTTLPETTPTKKEKGTDYGMKSVSDLGLEVDEQMNNLAAYMVGKTVEEVLATPTEKRDDAHPAVPAGEDLKTTVSINIADYLAAFEVAAKNAVEVEGVASVGTASVTSLSGSDATEDKDGQVQANTTYALVGLTEDGTIAYVYWDVAQNAGKFGTDGAVTAAEAAPTKKEKGDDYGMRSSSEIGKELFEQVEALEEYSIVKTVADVLATPTEKKDDHHTAVPTDEDLKTSVTISIGDYLAALEKAAANATPIE